MASAAVRVTTGDLPQVQRALAEAAEKIEALQSLLQQWEPRVLCPQCGQRYSERACGPTHAIVWFHVHGPEVPAPPSDEDCIREAMAEAQDHPGKLITR